MAAEGRDTATPEEQETLSGFTGWGQFPTLFNTTSSEWTKERKQLKDLLSADEFKAADSASGNTNKPSWHAASRATLNSHFTSPQIVDAHWQAAQRLGFDGGRYLEPSIGSGYYVGMMPEELAKKTSVTGVELDRTTAQVAQALYPSASIRHQGFEQFQAPDNFFDLAASNVPFGDYPIHERRYNRFQAPIHDHFFLKSLDKVRPGGLVMHITSTGTMDKGNSRIRKEMASQADLIAAIRLPGKTHADAAGTEVVTDLVILRKRTDAGEAPEETPEDVQPDPGYTGVLTDSLGRVYHFVDGKRVANDFWVETTTVPDPAGGEDIPVNQYFADNPQQILGTLDRTGTMYRSDSKNVTPPEDFDGALQAAIERLPEGIYKPSDGTRAGTPELVATDVKNGTLSIRDGEAVQYRSGAYYRIDVPKAAIDRIAAADKLRNTLRELIGQDKAGETSDEARVKLNDHYDAFVKAHGALHDTANLRTLAQDPDMPLLLSLENWDAKKKKATKADIFEHNTIRPAVSVTSAESVVEGLGVSLNETGRVDVEMIASLTGMTKEHVEDEFRHSGLAFHDPEQGWQSRAEYLSGNVRHKLKLAQAAAEQDPNFKPNVLALEANQPDEIAHDDISARLGVPWIPREDMNSFAAHLLNGEAKDFDIRYVSATGGWVADYARGGNNWISSGPAANAWGTPHKSFMTILDAALNNKSIKVYGDEDADGKKQLDKKATDDVRGKIQDMRDAFAEWLWSSPERRSRLHKLYNDEYNNIRPMEYDGSHLTYPGMNPSFKMRSVQDNFVWQTITRGKGILAHEVGIGKTSTMVAAAMELRRLGLAKKPAIVCLKANLEQLTADAQSLYPGARILSTSGQFTAGKRKEMVSRIATGDYDMVFMSHDHLNMLPMSSEVQQRFISQEIEELEAAAALVQTEDKSRKSNAVKALEKRKATLEARLQKAIDSKKDDQITFEETGIDFLMVDESQAYKNLPVYTSMQELAGISSAPSDRASNMLMRTRWLQEQHDGRGVVFATGTPISNSMAEMYSLQRYLQPEELEARGLTTFDAWANTFGEFETSLEPDLKGGYKSKTRFSNFVNVPELMQIARQDMDVRRVDSLPPNPDKSPAVLRPNKREHMVLAPATDVVKSMMTDIHSRARAIEGKRAEKGADNPLSITTAGRQGSVDPRLYDSSFEDHPDSKVNKMVRNVLERYKDPEFKGQTQLIFSDIGVHPNGSSGFHLYGDIIDKLVKGGIPREEIADFSQLEGKARLDAASRLRSGKTRIAIGGTERLGTGLNVQTRLTALHHIDVPYKPAATEQRNGRGHRFGNQNKDIDVFHYITEGSLDEMSWGIVGRKANFIKQAVTDPKAGQRRISEEDAEALTPQQLMAAASGDMRILERVNLRSQVDTLTRARSRHERNQEELKSRSVSAARKVENLVAQAKRVASDSSAVSKDFHIDVNGKQTTDSTKAKEMLADAIAEADQQQHAHRSNVYPYREPDPVHIGSVRGLKLLRDAGSYTLEGPSGERYRTGDSLQSIEHVIRNLPKREETLKAEAAHTRGDIESITRQIGKTFSQAAALEAARANLDRLDKELKGEMSASTNDTHIDKYAGLFDEAKHPRDHGKFAKKPGVAGQQMGLFHGDEQPGQQKTLFNVVKPKASSKQQVAAKIQASLLERIEDDLKKKSVDAKPLAGQKELFSRVRSDMTRFIASQYNDDIDRYDMPGQRDLFSGGERRSTKTQGKMRWVTIGGHADGEAQHAGGQAVKIDGDGTIIGGNVPKSWQGQNVRTAASGGSAGGGRPGSQDQQSAPVEAPAQKQGQPVTLGVKQLGNRWYAMATLPDGKMVTRSHDDREAAVKLGHDDIERAGHHVGGEQSHLKGLWNTMKKGEAATQPAVSSETSSVDAAIGKLTHVQNVDQVTGQAGSIWDNMESARKEYPDRKEFAKAVADKWREGRAAAFDAKRGGERHDDLLGASRAAFKHNGQTIDADAAAQRAADRASAPVAEESADTDYGWQDPPFEKMPGEMSDAGRAIEQKTQQRAREDYAKFRAAYIQKNGRMDADGNLAAITLNTDEWREHFPEYHGTNAAEVHEACSYLNKRLLNEALHTLKGKGNNTILTLAGGGGSGKGTATQEFLAGKDYPIILDQVSDKVTKSFDAIKKAKDNGYDAEIMYVDREPSDAFRNGVRSRALHSRKKGEPARTVPVDIALKANIAARNAMVELIQSNPDSKWSVVNNNNGYGQAVQLTNPEDAVQFLQRQDFDFESLKEAMTNDTKRLHERGELPDDIAEGLLPGYTVKNGRLQPRSASGSNRDGAQDEREGSGGVSGAEDQGAAHRSSGERTEAAGGGIPEPGTDGFMNVNDLERDPTRFQYKMNTNAEGVTNQFSDVKYNPMLGGKLAVWKDPENGKAYVVNGHHRHELAQRSGYDGQVTVHHIDAKTHEEARAFGALINIAGGNGTAVDAAKFMRDTGTSLDEMSEKGVSVTQGMGRDAGILAKLSPRLFGQLAQGLYRQGRALAIGQHLDNHDDQERVSKLVDQREDKTGRTVSDTTVAEIARQAAVASRTTEKQKGLFGEEEDDRSLFIERAELVGGLRRQMAERLNKFKAVSTDKAAGVLSENNSIDAGANRAEADRLRNQVADFDRESTLRGPVGDILNKAAKEYADEPKRKPEILKRLASDISEHFANLQSGPRSGDGPDRPEQSDSSGGIEERQPYKSAPGQRDFFSRQRSGQRSVRMTDPVALASAITSRIMERV